MKPTLPFLVAILACFTMAAQPYKSLKELAQILKNLATDTAAKHLARSFQYRPRYSRLGLRQRSQNREENNRNYNSAQSREFYHQFDNVRTPKQLADDLEQVLIPYSDRICKGNGKCDCPWGKCGRQGKAEDKTVTEMEQLLRVLDKDINKQRNRNFQNDEVTRQKYGTRREKYDVEQQQYVNQRQQYENRQQDVRRLKYGDRRQKQDDRWQKYYDRRPKQHDRRQKYDDRRHRQEQDDRGQELEDRRQEYMVQKQDDNDEIDKNLETRNYKNADVDIVIFEARESNEFQNRANDVRLVDITESAIKDLLQQRQTSYDKKEEEDRRMGNLNLEDFVAYYGKFKEELTNGLLKYVKGFGDD